MMASRIETRGGTAHTASQTTRTSRRGLDGRTAQRWPKGRRVTNADEWRTEGDGGRGNHGHEKQDERKGDRQCRQIKRSVQALDQCIAGHTQVRVRHRLAELFG